VPTGIWTARRRRRVRRRRRQRRRRRRRTALIKSSNPHLSGGEKKTSDGKFGAARIAGYGLLEELKLFRSCNKLKPLGLGDPLVSWSSGCGKPVMS